MEFSHDEVRRQLASSHRAQRHALPTWREALKRTFDADQATTEQEKARLLGLADRRGFLRIGGVAIAMSAVLAACGDDAADEQLPVTGTFPPSPGEPLTAPPGSEALDLNLLRTAQSIEVLAVQTYQQALDSDLVTTTAVADAAGLFQEHHEQHGDAIASVIEGLGGEPYDDPNPFLERTVVGPAVEVLATEEEVVALAVTLENTAAQTYVFAAEVLTTPQLRQGVMTIGAVEARHLAALNILQELPAAPFGFMPRRARIDENGYVDGRTGLDARPDDGTGDDDESPIDEGSGS
jgi:hypothetical protein